MILHSPNLSTKPDESPTTHSSSAAALEGKECFISLSGHMDEAGFDADAHSVNDETFDGDNEVGSASDMCPG